MAGDIKIEKSQIISGSRISRSRISHVSSERTSPLTPDMWRTLFQAVDASRAPRDQADARTLQTLVDAGQVREAKPIWQRLRGGLGDLANLAKIIEGIDTLLR